jgi:type IV secretion system protein VirB9
MHNTSKYTSAFIVASCAFFALPTSAQPNKAASISAAIPGNLDARIVTFAYTPDVVYKLNVTVGMHTHIVMGPDEELIELPRVGDSIRWRVEGNEKNLYVKAIAPDTVTSLSLVTNRRVYQFELAATDRPNERVQKAIFSYPDDDARMQARINVAAESARIASQAKTDVLVAQNIAPESIDPADLQFLTVTASNPAFNGMHAYTDGIRTYMRMPPGIQDLPAVFMVETNERNKELLMPVNYTVLDRRAARDRDVIVIDRLAETWVLQIGTKSQVRITSR